MKKYYVEVNGTPYEVVISENKEEIARAGQNTALTPVLSEETPIPAAASSTVSGTGESVTAPMPGTILKVNVSAGQSVKAGDALMILEAMKMENEIMAPKDGIVTTVCVQNGVSVEPGTPLCFVS